MCHDNRTAGGGTGPKSKLRFVFGWGVFAVRKLHVCVGGAGFGGEENASRRRGGGLHP
ncbi:MAG: hypothetical protein LBI86_10505 [Treponema sp.]|nr:hypothetical protein [Treponema sp.]